MVVEEFRYITDADGNKKVAFFNNGKFVDGFIGSVWITPYVGKNSKKDYVILSSSASEAFSKKGYFIEVDKVQKIGATTYSTPSTNTKEAIAERLLNFFPKASTTSSSGGSSTTTTTTTAEVKLWIYRLYKKVGNVIYHGWEMEGETPTIYRITLTTTEDSDGIATTTSTRDVARKPLENYAETTGWTTATITGAATT